MGRFDGSKFDKTPKDDLTWKVTWDGLWQNDGHGPAWAQFAHNASDAASDATDALPDILQGADVPQLRLIGKLMQDAADEWSNTP